MSILRLAGRACCRNPVGTRRKMRVTALHVKYGLRPPRRYQPRFLAECAHNRLVTVYLSDGESGLRALYPWQECLPSSFTRFEPLEMDFKYACGINVDDFDTDVSRALPFDASDDAHSREFTVISLERDVSEAEDWEYQVIARDLIAFGFTVRRFVRVEGEKTYDSVMPRLIQHAVATNRSSLAVLYGGVRLACDFVTRLRELQRCPRCGAHLFSSTGGVLVLSSHMEGLGRSNDQHELKQELFSPIVLNRTHVPAALNLTRVYEGDVSQFGGWPLAFDDMDRHRMRFDVNATLTDMQCYSHFPQRIGSFGYIFHRNALMGLDALNPESPQNELTPVMQRVLANIDELDYIYESHNFDAYLYMLDLAGFIVRVSHPTLAVPYLHVKATIGTRMPNRQRKPLRLSSLTAFDYCTGDHRIQYDWSAEELGHQHVRDQRVREKANDGRR